MQGILILLLSFFAVCWTLVIGYHTGLFMNVSHLESFSRGTMPLAYTGCGIVGLYGGRDCLCGGVV